MRQQIRNLREPDLDFSRAGARFNCKSCHRRNNSSVDASENKVVAWT
ncbi:MAG: hypothetical protein IPK34_17235 [Ramlibacter sp.]|nr:hypothetical protein [Ramlibacter sp.]